MVTNSSGSLHFPMVMILCLFLLAGLGFWQLMKDWRKSVETQLRLNRCVGEAAMTLRGHLNILEKANHGIKAARAAIQSAQAAKQFYLIPPLLKSIQALVSVQEVQLSRWKVRQATWLVKMGCATLGDVPSVLPSLDVDREMADTAGQQPLHWVGERPQELKVFVQNGRRKSAAKIWLEVQSALFPDSWHADWASPR